VSLRSIPAQAQARVASDDRHAVEWRPEWRRSDAFDYVLSLGLFAGYAATLVFPKPEDEPHWVGPVLLDAPLRRAFGAEGIPARKLASTTSDVALWVSIGHVVADATAFAMLRHDAPDVGWELLVMDAEAYSATLILNALTKRITSRARPNVESCESDPNYDPKCGDRERYSSFYSGHAAVTATSAGLLCSQHTRLPLYGDGWDTAACVNGVLMTSLTGVLRVVSDRHWASDVVTGHVIGFSSGFFLPQLLHFRSAKSQGKSDELRLLAIMPALGDSGGLGFSAFGVF
jgi:membrane-associated phospholipid phosphatase